MDFVCKLKQAKRVAIEMPPRQDFRVVHVEVGLCAGRVVARSWTNCQQTLGQEVWLCDDILPHVKKLVDARLEKIEKERQP